MELEDGHVKREDSVANRAPGLIAVCMLARFSLCFVNLIR